ncbi:hypothetical protein ACFQX7_03140 [Luedemannella flava]
MVVLLGAAVAAGNTALTFATMGLGEPFLPFIVGFFLCVSFLVAVGLLHSARWLAILSLLPALFVMVGSSQLAPELALQQRGVRHEVTILDYRYVNNEHTFTVRGDEAGVLAQPLTYAGPTAPYQVGDRLAVVVDPQGVIEIMPAGDVDPDGKVAVLVVGLIGWTVIAMLAGWRGHVRRHERRATAPAGGVLLAAGEVAAGGAALLD